MKIRTSITDIRDGKEYIRERALSDLIKEKTFVEVIFLLLRGILPTTEEMRMMNAILVSIVDHGPAVASAIAARVSASAKNPLHASVAAGLLGMGERHGMAITAAMRFFLAYAGDEHIPETLADMKQRKEYVPGYGHKIFTEDPRTKTLLAFAIDARIVGIHCAFAERVEALLQKTASKKLPLNVDGCIAAILCDMGFSPEAGDGIFVIARVPGLIAQILEEIASGEGVRRLADDEVQYAGKNS